jgi:glycine/D-amino acid oxidase-like deaminating enzyme
MQRSVHGFWLADVDPVVARPVLGGREQADVLVIGGGYLGLWTAWHLAEAGADVIVAEADVCGHGPSGRNGGFVNGLWDCLVELRELFGDGDALRVARAAGASVDAIEAWCAAQDLDAHLVRAPMLEVAAAPGQEDSWADAVLACRQLGVGEEVREVTAEGARAVCDSPVFGAGALWTSSATVHPARLALGLRARLLERGVRIFEHTQVEGVDDGPGGVRARVVGGGEVIAGSAVLAINQASAGVGPLRGALSVASSHVVATEPVPDVRSKARGSSTRGAARWTCRRSTCRGSGRSSRCTTASASPATAWARPSSAAGSSPTWPGARRPSWPRSRSSAAFPRAASRPSRRASSAGR